MVSYKLRFETLPYTKAIVYGIFYLAEEIGAGGAVVCCGVLWIFWECQPAAEKNWRGQSCSIAEEIGAGGTACCGGLWIFGICPGRHMNLRDLPRVFCGSSEFALNILRSFRLCPGHSVDIRDLSRALCKHLGNVSKIYF